MQASPENTGAGLASLSLSPPPAPALTTAQLHALFDIITHYETYREIQSFKEPDTIYQYGFPFVLTREDAASDSAASSGGASKNSPQYAAQSATPILHMLLNNVVLTLPPAKLLPDEFWRVRIQHLMRLLAEAELSESYDQGAMGARKVLATASSALIESVSRGILGGYPTAGIKYSSDNDGRTGHKGQSGADAILATGVYDTANAEDSLRAWDDVMRALIYGRLVDDLFDFAAKNGQFEEHSAGVRAAVDYIIIHLSEFLHYVFVLSPNGRYLTKLLENIQTVAPYGVIRQTLRVSNAATMVTAMMRVLLAKLSVGGLTNWIGLTTSADDGMNLLQRIMAMVLSWDASNFKKAAEKIERARDGPSRAHLAAIREHVARPRAFHVAVRRASEIDGQSIIVSILDSVDPELADALTASQHAQCAQYYSAQLSIRDRREITNVFCRQNPDFSTQALRDIVTAVEPLIRRVHDKIDLKEHVSDAEAFINEFIEVSKGRKIGGAAAAATTPQANDIDENLIYSSTPTSTPRELPTVKDYVELLRRNRGLLYKWLHRIASETPEIRESFRQWANDTIKLFRVGSWENDTNETSDPAPNITVSPSSENQPPNPTASSAQNAKIAQKKNDHLRVDDGAGSMDADLTRLFSGLPADTQARVRPLLDAHADYLTMLDDAASRQRQTLLDQIYSGSTSEIDKAAEQKSKPPKSPSPSRSPSFPAFPRSPKSPRSPRSPGLAPSPLALPTTPLPVPPQSPLLRPPSSSGLPTAEPQALAGSTSTSSSPQPEGALSAGSGRFLARWQELLDDTVIGPATPGGPLRRGRDVAHLASQGKGGSSGVGADGESPTSTSGPSRATSRSDTWRADSWGLGSSGGSGSRTSSWRLGKSSRHGSARGSANNSASNSKSRRPSPQRALSLDLLKKKLALEPPDVQVVVDALGGSFQELLKEKRY